MGARAQLRARRALGVALAGAALVLIAFVFDAAPLFVPGIAFAAIGVLAPAWVLWSVRGARVRRLLDSDRVLEDGVLWTTLEVRRPLSPDGWGRLQIVDPESGSRAGLGGPGSPLRHARVGHVRVAVRMQRRGEHMLAAPTLVARDPFALAHARQVGETAAQTVLVLPRLEPVRRLAAGSGARVAGSSGDHRGEALAATDLEGLRPYRPGTPASRIHWPALARGRGLIERRLQADADQRPLVVLDARSRREEPAALDAAVRAVGSIALELAGLGGCGLLLPGQARPTVLEPALSAWAAIHARLAVVGTPADPQVSASDRPPALAAAGRGGPLYYVAAVSHARLIAVLSGMAGRGGSIVLVVPESEVVDGRPRGAGARAVPVLSVSGCRGFALGAGRAGPARGGVRVDSPAPAVGP